MTRIVRSSHTPHGSESTTSDPAREHHLWLQPLTRMHSESRTIEQLPAHSEIAVIREHVLTNVLRLAAFLGLIGMFFSIKPMIDQGVAALIPLYLGITLLFVVIAVYRRFKYALRGWMLLSGSYLLGLTELLHFGFSEDGYAFMAATALFATLFFSPRIGRIMLLICLATLLGIGLTIGTGAVAPLSHTYKIVSVDVALVIVAVFLTLVGTLQASIIMLLQHLEYAWQREHQARMLLEQERDLLEIRVAERTRELAAANSTALHELDERIQAERLLQQSTRELKQQNAELEAFAHTVAHDLKTPLNTIIGYSQLIQLEYPELGAQEARTQLRIIFNTGMKMVGIIDELLLLARVRTMEHIPIEPLQTARILDEALRRLHLQIEQRRAPIVRPASWPEALGYAPWIEEVWVNYLSNACKYSNADTVIEIGADPPHNGFVRFWVRDNGPGLSEEQQSRLFTPFTRIHTDATHGYGLGLSIVRRIIEKLHGQVGVQSTPGVGSTFFFCLPATPLPMQKEHIYVE